MNVDTEKLKILKLVCHFTMFSTGVAEQKKEVIASIDMSSKQHDSGEFYDELVISVLDMVTHCAGSEGTTDLDRVDKVIFYYMDTHGDRVWVASPTAFSVFLKANEALVELKLFACSKLSMRTLCCKK